MTARSTSPFPVGRASAPPLALTKDNLNVCSDLQA